MKFFVFVLVILIIIGVYFAVIKVDENEYCVLVNKNTHEVDHICLPGYNFVIKNIGFWRYSIACGKITSSTVLDIQVPLPGLADLDSKYYTVKVKLQIKYAIDLENASDEILEKREELIYALKVISKESFETTMLPYWYPIYNNTNLEKSSNEIIDKSFDAIKKRCEKNGIKILELTLLTPLRVPSYEIYKEGVLLAAELRKIENDYKKEQLSLENKLKKDEIEHKKYLENLRNIANVVRNNPDLLKYLYITGFSKNVTSIIASDRTGMPFGFDFEGKDAEKRSRGDVDNLR